MAALSLTCRKAQLKLLEECCARRQRIRVVALAGRPAQPPTAHARFLAVGRQELLLQPPRGGVTHDLATAPSVDGYFDHGGQRYGFRTRASGLVACHTAQRGPIKAWRLALPLCVERRQQRAYSRITVGSDDAPIRVRFTSVVDPDQAFMAELTNISGGGLGGTATRAAASVVRTGRLYWTSFALPDDGPPFDFVVRLMHARSLKARDRMVLGCMFCPGEDPMSHHAKLSRIERFVACRKCRPSLPVGVQQGEGVEPCW